MTFPVSNQNVKSTVLSFIKLQRFPHAILIEGENSAENTALAEFLATAAVCGKENSPCGACRNCHQAQVKSHPDITCVSPLDGKKNLSVDQIRAVRSDAFVKPHSADRRAFILNEANRMNAQAQNALLKVLEEPPAGVVFILIAPSKTYMLDTIISRCVLLSLSSAAEQDNYSDEASRFVDLMISGSEYEMLKLLSVFEKNRVAAENFMHALAVECAKRMHVGGVYARAIDKFYDDIKYYLELLKTNINMALFSSLVVSRAKSLLDI